MDNDIVVLLIILLLGTSVFIISSSYPHIERFCTYSNNKHKKDVIVIENFGFENDKPADPELIANGLNDCNAIIGTGDGIRDMFDFSDRFITAHIDASNDIPIIIDNYKKCK